MTTYSEQISNLIHDLTVERNYCGERDRLSPDAQAARELSIAITALEDAQMRVNRAGSWIKDRGITVSNRF